MCLSISDGAVAISLSDHVGFFLHLLNLDGWVQSSFSFSSSNTDTHLILSNLRWPRLLLAVCVGACLAAAGATLQGLFRNPLADPALIGISSGALLGASITTVLISWWQLNQVAYSQAMVISGAFLGALTIALTVFYIAKKLAMSSQQMILYMLLIGIAVSAFSVAGSGLSKYFLTANELRQVTLWQLGSLQPPNWSLMAAILLIVTLVIYCMTRLHNPLNILALGAEQAMYLGVNLKKLQYQVVILSAIGVGLCVSVAGLIGFVGLVAPHAVRLLIGPNHRFLISGSALMGAILLVFSDYLSRQIFPTDIIPVGIITAIIGAPWFLWVLLHTRNRAS
jgi:iron complex transport system permease protein